MYLFLSHRQCNIWCNIYIKPSDPPSSPVISSKSILLENSSNQFRCSASKGKPYQTYTWKIGEKPLNGQETLIFTPSYLDNGKELSCMVTNDYTQVKKKNLTASVTLSVECEYNRNTLIIILDFYHPRHFCSDFHLL